MNANPDAVAHTSQLERRIAALEKTNAVLIRDAERRTQVDQSAYDLFKSASVLEDRVNDRTARLKEVQEQLRESLSLVRATLDSTADGILVVDSQQSVVDYNGKFLELWGIPPEMMENRDESLLLEFVSKKMVGSSAFVERVGEMYADPTAVYVDEVHLTDGRVFERNSIPHRIGGETIGRVWSFRDVTEHRRAIEQLRTLANFDGLTGLPNRALFSEELKYMLSRAARDNSLAAVLFMDLDRFKSVNDTLGHSAGDQLLREVATRVKKCLRDSDIIARQGGDEITIGLGEIASPELAATVAARILRAFHEPFLLDGHQIYSSTSIGISVYPQDGVDGESLLKTADSAMYLAKESGRGVYQFFTEDLTEKARVRLDTESGLRRALEYGEFVLHYQPQIDLTNDRTVGFEALVRWEHPEEGLLYPGSFIPLAEETGLIIPLGEWVLREACQQWRRWVDSGRPPVIMSVNLSIRQFRQKNLIESIRSIIDETGMDAARLELELTESTFVTDADLSAGILTQLKALGVRLAIDDFGTGHSSLNYLRRFPVDTLKIDRSFIENICTSSDDAAIGEAIIALAHALRLDVLAEGVENSDQREFLQQRRCNLAQGYHFGRPVPAAEAMELLPEPVVQSRGADLPAAPVAIGHVSSGAMAGMPSIA
jgi:diguanylate cyclase (GGDEF)-like protein/PAS domain S-box-containing protein